MDNSILDISVFGISATLFIIATILTCTCQRKVIEDEQSEDINQQFPEVEVQNAN